MKKTFKKIMAALLAVAMLCAMAVPAAFADDGTFKITAPNNDHTYEIYQVFTGTPSTDTDGNKILSDIRWGKNAASAYTEGNPVSSDVLTGLTSATGESTILNLVKTYVDLNGLPAYTVSSGSSVSVPAGYYLIKDDESLKVESYTLYIVEVIDGDITITPKTDAPSVEKKVQENSKVSDTTYGAGYNDTADYSIGDMVPFKLIGRIPSMAHYTSYKYIFHDTLSNSFDAPSESSIKVSLSNDKGEEGSVIDSSYYTVAVNGNEITVSFDDLKQVPGVSADKYIVVTYSAKLNASASIGQGTPGNTNEVYLEYSNNPNNTGTGNSTHDKVIVFTYQLDVTKIDGSSSEKLANAEFKLLNSTKDKAAKVENGKFVEWVEENEGSVLTTDNKGLFSVTGLDDGTYYLKETKAPTGYNTLENPIKIVISADTSNGQNGAGDTTELKNITIAVDDGESQNGNAATGTVGATIKNNKGATLPSTGGIGTTLFYVIGGGLMVAAAVLLITKKRMESK